MNTNNNTPNNLTLLTIENLKNCPEFALLTDEDLQIVLEQTQYICRILVDYHAALILQTDLPVELTSDENFKHAA